MSRVIPFALFVFLFVTPSYSGETMLPGPGIRASVLAAVNAEFVRVRHCGVASGPTRYLVDHFAVEDEWACISGTALYQYSPSPFTVEFIALLKWNCGSWKVSAISFDPGRMTRRPFLGLRQVPSAILPRWIRWSP